VERHTSSEAALWVAGTVAAVFFGYLVIDGLRHWLKWRRLVRKGEESRERHRP
jgi:hypothetical protein